MGKTAAETRQEIVALRQEVASAAMELDRQITELLDVRARLDDLGDWALRTAEEKPNVVAGAGAGVAVGIALLGLRAINERRRKKTATARLAALKDTAQEEASRRLEEAISHARELLAAGGARVASLSEQNVDAKTVGSEPSMLKKLIWTALTAGSLAIAGILARKISTSIWQAIMHEEPPTTST